jgi:hypothetical protein
LYGEKKKNLIINIKHICTIIEAEEVHIKKEIHTIHQHAVGGTQQFIE